MKSEQSFSLAESTLVLLRDLIEERMGINYEIGSFEFLAEKLLGCALDRGFDSLLDYYYFLKYDESADGWNRLVDAMTVPETYFWREMDQIRAVVDVLVPEYFTKCPSKSLRIWSAACATGEEPLSIAMALNELRWFYRAPIEIYASDLCQKSLDKAKTGLYGERSFRNLPLSLQEKYFSRCLLSSESSFFDKYKGGMLDGLKEGGENVKWLVSPDLHRRIHWSQANLKSESEIKFLASCPIIFCRNVFIYFSQKSIRQTLRMFAEYMPTPAYLCVSASESLFKLTEEFNFAEIGGAFIYVKS